VTWYTLFIEQRNGESKMNRAEHILAMTPEQRYKARLRFAYRFLRRRGFSRAEAPTKALAMVARLTGMVAVMEASDWTADPLRVARLARAVEVAA
jgi:hypothetical protein